MSTSTEGKEFRTVQDEQYAPLLVKHIMDRGQQAFHVRPVCSGGKCEYVITVRVKHKADLTNYLGIKWEEKP